MIYTLPTDTCFWLACSIQDEAGFLDIYKIKWRNYNKPLSIVVKNFDDLIKIIEISPEQINYLKNYQFPFTILWEKKDNFLLPEFLDKNMYSKIAIRIADICIPQKISKELQFPLFLTSANISWKEEIFDSDEIIGIFENKENLKIFPWKIEKKSSSNIFEFVWNTLELKYLRQNY